MAIQNQHLELWAGEDFSHDVDMDPDESVADWTAAEWVLAHPQTWAVAARGTMADGGVTLTTPATGVITISGTAPAAGVYYLFVSRTAPGIRVVVSGVASVRRRGG